MIPQNAGAQLSDCRCVHYGAFDKNRVRCSASRFILDPLLREGQTFGGLMNIVSIRNIAKSVEDLLKAFCPGRSKGLPSYRANTTVVNCWTQTQIPTATQWSPHQFINSNHREMGHHRPRLLRRRTAARSVRSVLLSYKRQRGVTIERG